MGRANVGAVARFQVMIPGSGLALNEPSILLGIQGPSLQRVSRVGTQSAPVARLGVVPIVPLAGPVAASVVPRTRNALAPATRAASVAKPRVLGRLRNGARKITASAALGRMTNVSQGLDRVFGERARASFPIRVAYSAGSDNDEGTSPPLDREANLSEKPTQRIMFGSLLSLNTLHDSMRKQANILRRASAHKNVLQELRKVADRFQTSSLLTLGLGTAITPELARTVIFLGGKTGEGGTLQTYGELWTTEKRGDPNIRAAFTPSSEQQSESGQILLTPPILVDHLSERIDHLSSVLDQFFGDTVFSAKVNYLRSLADTQKAAIMASGLDIEDDGGTISISIDLFLYQMKQPLKPFGRLRATKPSDSDDVVVHFVPSENAFEQRWQELKRQILQGDRADQLRAALGLALLATADPSEQSAVRRKEMLETVREWAEWKEDRQPDAVQDLIESYYRAFHEDPGPEAMGFGVPFLYLVHHVLVPGFTDDNVGMPELPAVLHRSIGQLNGITSALAAAGSEIADDLRFFSERFNKVLTLILQVSGKDQMKIMGAIDQLSSYFPNLPFEQGRGVVLKQVHAILDINEERLLDLIEE